MLRILHSRMPSRRAPRKVVSAATGSATPVKPSTQSAAAFRLSIRPYTDCGVRPSAAEGARRSCEDAASRARCACSLRLGLMLSAPLWAGDVPGGGQRFSFCEQPTRSPSISFRTQACTTGGGCSGRGAARCTPPGRDPGPSSPR